MTLLGALLAWGFAGLVLAQPVTQGSGTGSLAAIEDAYADFNDARGAIALIDSGLSKAWDGKDRDAWQRVYDARRQQISDGLAKLEVKALKPADARAVTVMKKALADAAEDNSLAPVGKCQDAQRRDLNYAQLGEALYACFDEYANNLDFEGQKVTRVGAFDLLTRMDEPERRKKLFYAFVPLWRAVNGNSEPDSPYRRGIRLAAQEAKSAGGSRIDAAARTINVSSAELEQWLVQILDTWRQVSGTTPIEPWDYRYVSGAAERELGPTISREAMQPLNERYYLDLGADLKKWGVLYDLDPRRGKAPLAYTDYVRRGRVVSGTWQPTLVRVSGNYSHGGLGLMNELVHENGHAVHMMAIHTRPAFMDLGDAVFYEAFADVPSWQIYEPAWQRKYLGRSADESSSLRALHSTVMLDVAWALFEARMLREPDQDPNVVWTEVTHRYLHVVPHPELSWWAQRVQLVYAAGYMVNYGLGAVVTADVKQRIEQQLGPFAAGDARWYGWTTGNLLGSGQEHETATLLRDFLGRPVSPQALLAELRRIGKARE